MKPREDGEGVAMNKTSKKLSYPNMTQDEPERVEDVWRVGRDAYIDSLIAKISVSEKRAEEKIAALAEARSYHEADSAAFMSVIAKLQSERDSSQASLLRVVEALKNLTACTGKPRPEEWLHPQAYQDALRAYDESRTALSPHTEK